LELHQGKTSIAMPLALKELFKFVHSERDDVRAKNLGPVFIQNVERLLRDHDVVIADK